MKNPFKFLKVVELRYKLCLFSMLLIISLFWLACIATSHKKQVRLRLAYESQVAEQMAWLGKGEEIYKKFDDVYGQLKGNRRLKKSLMRFVEKAASKCDCKYELSNEQVQKIGDICISSVNATLHSISLSEFVRFSEAVMGEGVRMGDVRFLAGKDGNLNVKCSIEAVLWDKG